MSKRRCLFICLVLCLKDGHQPVLFPITSTFNIIQLLSLRRLWGCFRILDVLCPRVVPETVIERLDSFKTPLELNSHRATADDDD